MCAQVKKQAPWRPRVSTIDKVPRSGGGKECKRQDGAIWRVTAKRGCVTIVCTPFPQTTSSPHSPSQAFMSAEWEQRKRKEPDNMPLLEGPFCPASMLQLPPWAGLEIQQLVLVARFTGTADFTHF